VLKKEQKQNTQNKENPKQQSVLKEASRKIERLTDYFISFTVLCL